MTRTDVVKNALIMRFSHVEKCDIALSGRFQLYTRATARFNMVYNVFCFFSSQDKNESDVIIFQFLTVSIPLEYR
jgi:hypothetical protein